MPWQYEVTDVQNSGNSVEITVRFARVNASGTVVESMNEGMSFRREDCPSKPELDRRLMERLVQIAEASNRISDISGSIGVLKAIPSTLKLFPREPADVSAVDKRMLALKAEAKDLAVTYIHQEPACSMDELARYVASQMQPGHEIVSGLLRVIFFIYATSAMRAGIIQEASFEAMRDFIAGKTVEELTGL